QCNDHSNCTLDACVTGLCRRTLEYDPQMECCVPATGTQLLIDDADPCTADVCDSDTGMVSHPPASADVACDDGRICTYSDACDGAGGCAGVDLNTRSCSTSADCLGLGSCDVGRGLCTCSEQAGLCLEIAIAPARIGTCLAAGSDFDVNVELLGSPSIIVGGQFWVKYDPTVLTLLDISPGRLADPSSPFELELARQVNASQGTVFYAVSVSPLQVGTRGPATMATLHFRSANGCAAIDALCFSEDDNLPNRLTDNRGQSVSFEGCCTPPISFTLGGPVLNCPSSVTRIADAGRLATTVTWSAPSAASPCDGPLQLVCTGRDSHGFPIDPLAQTGGTFGVGVASFRCTAVDSCGIEGSCEWTVEVRPESTFVINLELSAPMTAGPL
ncbi:MAG: HYR domain-containing protein, partial [Phycisphaerales bacterium]|nr:HYR domain-containing protein [Phycisphaerales bacterium]